MGVRGGSGQASLLPVSISWRLLGLSNRWTLLLEDCNTDPVTLHLAPAVHPLPPRGGGQEVRDQTLAASQGGLHGRALARPAVCDVGEHGGGWAGLTSRRGGGTGWGHEWDSAEWCTLVLSRTVTIRAHGDWAVHVKTCEAFAASLQYSATGMLQMKQRNKNTESHGS